MATLKVQLIGLVDWAQKAYEDYNTKQALDYIRILDNRISKNELLKIQEIE